MKILCEYADCGPSFVRRGWRNVFSALGHDFVFWRPEVKPAFDIFTEYEPDVFLGTTYGLDRALYKCIVRRPHLKIALFASAWGKLADQIPEDYPITRARHDEKVTITTLKATCGQPEFVFSHVTNTYLDDLLGGWKETGVHTAGILNAADTFVYRNGTRREEFACDVAFVGGYWPYKARNLDPYLLPLCQPSSGLNVKIWGNQPWPVANYLGLLDDTDQAHVYRSAAVCPNVSEPHSHEFGYDVVERPFKVLAAGGFCLSDFVAEARHLFNSDELPMMGSPRSFHEALRYYLAHPEQARVCAAQGRVKVLRKHTYFHRVSQMLALLGYHQESVRCLNLHRQLVLEALDGDNLDSLPEAGRQEVAVGDHGP